MATSSTKKPRKRASAKGKRRTPQRNRAQRPVSWMQVGLVLALVCVSFVLVALTSYDPYDVAFTRSASGLEVQNLGGTVGAWLADLIYQSFGYTGWLLVFLPVPLFRKLADRATGWTWQRTGGCVLGVLCTGALLHLSFGNPETAPFPPGGVVGMGLGIWLEVIAGTTGAWIVVSGVLAVAATLVFAIDWQKVADATLHASEVLVDFGRQGVVWIAVQAGKGFRAFVSWAAAQVVEGWNWLKTVPSKLRHIDEDLLEEDSLPSGASGIYAEMADMELAAVLEGEGELPDAAELPAPPMEYMERDDRPTQHGGRALVEVEWEPTSPGCGDTIVRDEDPAAGAVVGEASRTVNELLTPELPPIDIEKPSAELLVAAAVAEARPSRAAVVATIGGVEAANVPSTAGFSAPDIPVAETRGAEAPIEEAVSPGPVVSVLTPEPSDGLAAVEPVLEREGIAQQEDAEAKTSSDGVAAKTQCDEDIELAMDPNALVSGGENDDGGIVMPTEPETIYELPTLSLLDKHERSVMSINEQELRALAHTLEEKLGSFGVKGEVTAIRPGPVITIFEYVPAPGIRVSKIAGLADDIAMAMRARRVRIVAPIPGRGVVGIEIPNRTRQTVWIRDILSSEVCRSGELKLPLALGKSPDGKPHVADLARMPHLLVGGTTGSGKSVGINAMMCSMLYARTPDELRMILIDPKMLEFEIYADLPHLLHPVVTDPRLANAALKWACVEMDRRYKLLARWNTRNIANYNEKVERELEDWTPEKARKYAPKAWPQGEPLPAPKKLPYIVIVIDELADLMMVAGKEVETSIVRLAQKARAAGVHLIVATQRPSVDVITGLIKANMPARIAYQVRSKTDGRTILDQNGAEQLLGMGDMLFLPPGVASLERVHGPFVADEEVERIGDFLRDQGDPQYDAQIRLPDESEDGLDQDEDVDEHYEMAVRLVVKAGKASTSMVQRYFKIGYNRAARIVDMMEREGVVGPADGARPREVLLDVPPE